VAKPTLKPSVWRAAAVGILDAAEDAESHADVDGRRVAAYEGEFNALGRRDGSLARATYENGDSYFGRYVDDQRHGKGVYLFANESAYAGARIESLAETVLLALAANLGF
jgi:hypothetical protein